MNREERGDLRVPLDSWVTTAFLTAVGARGTFGADERGQNRLQRRAYTRTGAADLDQ